MNGRILIVDDDAEMCRMLETDLRLRGYDPSWRLSGPSALAALDESSFDVVLTDMNMPGMNGLEVCARLKETRPDLPVVLITAFGSLEAAVEALRLGAYDFVTKPIELDVLAAALERAIRQRRLTLEVQSLHLALQGLQGRMLGDSEAMQRLNRLVGRIAPTDASVLISGESGTGKELAAAEIHRLSHRKDGPFVAINCAALPETLIESELFGHRPGAFTDARRHTGLFVQAHGGTLFLDEIGDLPLQLQPKLLRVLEERRVRALGAESEVSVDVRIVAATNRDLRDLVNDGAFREDLFYRLNVVNIDIPPLRARGNDVLLLAQHFTQRYAERAQKRVVGMSETVAQKLLTYSWPGNVRELRNAVERGVALTQSERLVAEDLPPAVLQAGPAPQPSVELVTLAEHERTYILRVYETTKGSRTDTARILGIDRKTLYRKLKEFGREH